MGWDGGVGEGSPKYEQYLTIMNIIMYIYIHTYIYVHTYLKYTL